MTIPSVSLRATSSVQLRVIKMIKHGVARSEFHGGTRRGILERLYLVYYTSRGFILCIVFSGLLQASPSPVTAAVFQPRRVTSELRSSETV